jgi:hypothetical protein
MQLAAFSVSGCQLPRVAWHSVTVWKSLLARHFPKQRFCRLHFDRLFAGAGAGSYEKTNKQPEDCLFYSSHRFFD